MRCLPTRQIGCLPTTRRTVSGRRDRLAGGVSIPRRQDWLRKVAEVPVWSSVGTQGRLWCPRCQKQLWSVGSARPMTARSRRTPRRRESCHRERRTSMCVRSWRQSTDADGMRTGARAVTYSGMLPCFLGGRVSRLFRSISMTRIRRGRVSLGSITSSTRPRSAATYGLLNCSS